MELWEVLIDASLEGEPVTRTKIILTGYRGVLDFLGALNPPEVEVHSVTFRKLSREEALGEGVACVVPALGVKVEEAQATAKQRAEFRRRFCNDD